MRARSMTTPPGGSKYIGYHKVVLHSENWTKRASKLTVSGLLALLLAMPLSAQIAVAEPTVGDDEVSVAEQTETPVADSTPSAQPEESPAPETSAPTQSPSAETDQQETTEESDPPEVDEAGSSDDDSLTQVMAAAMAVADASSGTSLPNLIPAETDRYKIGPVKPDVVYNTETGGRVEIYTSVGNLDGSGSDMDWRPISAFSYLVASVPKNSPFYATIYNTLWDGLKPTQKSDGTWEVKESKGVKPYAPTLAFLKQLNQYSAADQKKYVNTLGNKLTFKEAISNKSSLGLLLQKTGTIKLCTVGDGACFATKSSDSPLMHSKYALFSKTKDSDGNLRENVVWITSSNLNGTSGSKKTNYSVALYGDAKAYQGLLDGVWNPTMALARGTTSKGNPASTGPSNTNRTFSKFNSKFQNAATKGVANDDGNLVFYASPRKPGQDLEAETLTASTNSKLGVKKTDCKVYLVHSLFSSARTGITDGLTALKKDGCDVRLLLGSGSMANLADSYFSMGTSLREIIDRVEFANVHDKTLLVSYKANDVQKGTVWVGSANLNGTSLYFDELAVKINSPVAASAGILQFARLYALARSAPVTKVTKVSVSPSSFSLYPNGTTTLKAKAEPTKASVSSVYWRSSDENVATVDNKGKVTAKTAGADCANPATATITATSFSGVKQGTSVVSVLPASCPTTPPTTTADGTLLVSSAPSLSIKRYESPGKKRTVVVTWAQGDVDLDGQVQLQYLNKSGKWVNSSKVTVKKGRGTLSRTFSSSYYWRAKPLKVTTAKTKLDKTSYSKRIPVVHRTKSATTKALRIYGTATVYKEDRALFLLQWQNPYDSTKTTRLSLQYHNGKKWVDYKEYGKIVYFTIKRGETVATASATITKTRKWRFKTSSVAQPKGKKALYSNSITIKAK